jgi:hypothetical protein
VPTAKRSAKSLSNPGMIVQYIAGIVFPSTKNAVAKKRRFRNRVLLCGFCIAPLRKRSFEILCRTGRNRPGLRAFAVPHLRPVMTQVSHSSEWSPCKRFFSPLDASCSQGVFFIRAWRFIRRACRMILRMGPRFWKSIFAQSLRFIWGK